MAIARLRRIARMHRIAFAALWAALALAVSVPASATTPPSSESSITAMSHFVVLFRRHPGALSAAEQAGLGRDIGAWARLHNEAGHRLAPHILAPESRHAGPQREAEPLPVTALLFLEARDLDEAARVAESHPGMRYGFSAEVRAWSAPNPAPVPADATP